MTEWALVNTIIVAINFVVILYGVYLAKIKHDFVRHPKVMISAGLIFLVFLVSFVLRLLVEGLADMPVWESSPLGVQPRHILYTHEAFALLTVGLIGTTYWFAYKKDFKRHRKIAPWAATFWLFMSLFGIFDYFMIHVW